MPSRGAKGRAEAARAKADWERARRQGKAVGDAPIEAEYYDRMRAVVQHLDELFNGKIGGPGRKTGFVLMVFPFSEMGEGGHRCNYASNGADRRDIVLLMKEMIRRFEGQAEPGQGHA